MNKAFTLIEVSITIAIVAILLSISSLTLSNLQQHTYVDSTLETLISDIKNQQIHAMSGDTEGTGINKRYGIKFLSDRYVLFSGDTYNSSDVNNFTLSLNAALQFTSIRFPSAILQFERGSGEAIGVGTTSNSIIITNTVNGEQKQITVNKYGVITAVN